MRHIKLFAILIATMATIFSCQKQDEISLDSMTQTLTANAPGSGNVDETPDTKVDFTELASGNIELDWQVDDVITIYTSSKRVGNWKVKSVATDGKANFVKVDGDNLTNGVDYTAVYPASRAATLADRDDETIATQNQKADDNMEHLDDNLRMKSASFQMGSTISFVHEVAIMSVTFESSDVPTKARIVEFDGSNSFMTQHDLSFTNLSAGVSTAHFIMQATSGLNRTITFTVNGESSSKVSKKTSVPFVAGKRYAWNTTSVAPTNVPVKGITLDKATLTLKSDEFYDPQLVATITPSNATNKKIEWSSSNDEVVYIDNTSGDIMTPGGIGQATITATTEDGGFTATCKVTVTKQAPAGLMLADIDVDNIPEGNTWTIEDTYATANDSRKFEGLKAALESLSASRSVNIVFPNLTTLPGSALYNCNISAKWTFSAPNVTTVKNTALTSSENITKIDLPKATTFNHGLCDAESLTTLIIAKEGRVTSTNNDPFYDMQTKNIDLVTHPSNVDGFKFKLADGSLSTPFKCVNGVKAFVFADDAAVFVEGVSGAAPESYTLKSSSSATLYFAKYWNKERYNYPKAKWSSSNPDVVSVSKSQGSEVVIKGLKSGSSTITAEDEVGNKLTLIIYVVEPAKIGDYYYDNHTWSSVLDYKRTLIGYVIMVNKDDGYSGTVVENRMRDALFDYFPNIFGQPSLREGDLTTGVSNFSGMQNTREIFDWLLYKCFGNNEERFLDNFPVFKAVHAMNPEGTKYNDGAKGVWYLPAIYQLKTVMKNLQELNYLENVELSKSAIYRMASSTLWHETDRDNNIGYTHVYYLQYVDILDSWEQDDWLIDTFNSCRYIAIMDF